MINLIYSHNSYKYLLFDYGQFTIFTPEVARGELSTIPARNKQSAASAKLRNDLCEDSLKKIVTKFNITLFN